MRLSTLRPLARLARPAAARSFGFSANSGGGFGDDAFPVVRDALVPIVVEQTVSPCDGADKEDERRGDERKGDERGENEMERKKDSERRERGEETAVEEEGDGSAKDAELTPGARGAELRHLLAAVARARHLPWWSGEFVFSLL